MTAKSSAIYLDPAAPVAQRVEDLLCRMTLDEKIGQMNQCVGVEHFRANLGSLSEDDLLTNTSQAFYPGYKPDDLFKMAEQGAVGSFLHVLTLDEANRLQHHAMRSRLGIPLIFGIDAIHGNAYALDNTVYPDNLGLACSFDPDMACLIARQTAREMRAMNMHWTFNPNVEVARDPRWGRCGETFGEDPTLVSLMGAATVRGYQGDFGSSDVMACIKHFVGGGQSVNGTNGAPLDVSERTLREIFFPPFKTGVKAGAESLMVSHNEVNGYPAHCDRWLLTDVLRDEWGFNGIVVSDWDDIEHLYDLHHTALSLKDAYARAIGAGIDMHMHGPQWNAAVRELVDEGRISRERIDQSVRRILEAKFRLGLFEQPYADPSATIAIRLCSAHRATALEAARRSVVLLKNHNNVLPIERGRYKRILVTGINADDVNILGDWSARQERANVVTLLDGLRQCDPGCEFVFIDQGWDPRNMNSDAVEHAVTAAATADLVVCAAGEYMMRDRWLERTGGEDTDRSDISLVGMQPELIERLAATGKPLVLVLIAGRPLGIGSADSVASAVIEAWEPGMYGGTAIAEIIYGDVNPSAKLAITIPRSAGQIQMVYNHKPSAYFHPVVLTESTPLYPFGHGLSYTTFSYDNLRPATQVVRQGERFALTVDITNTGSRYGTEIAQLYLRDDCSSATRPVKELCAFARVDLAPGQTRTVTMYVEPRQMQILDRSLHPVYETGTFTVMIGGSSDDHHLLTCKFVLIK